MCGKRNTEEWKYKNKNYECVIDSFEKLYKYNLLSYVVSSTVVDIKPKNSNIKLLT